MTASRITRAFQARRGRTGLIPFVTAGYPSLPGTRELLRGFERIGCLAVEVGVPFSDPVADGPEIQRASEAALAGGVGLTAVIDLVRRFRAESELPIVLMTYANPIFRAGPRAFAAQARAAGVDGLIVSDLPPEEAPDAWAAFDDAGLDTILLVAPTTEDARMRALAARCRGFVYCLARTGVTGAGGGESGVLAERIAALRAACGLPIGVGFGIATPERVRELNGQAEALIVGAALMRAVREGLTGHGARSPHAGATDEGAAIEHALALAGALAGALPPA
jgi:tryptophan synthase alpha chain